MHSTTKLNFADLKIDMPVVSIFASGLSIQDLSQQDLDYLKANTYVIGTNAFHLKMTPRLLVWSDPNMSNFINKWMMKEGKRCLYATRETAFDKGAKMPDIYHNIDYWFDSSYYNLLGNFTFFFILQLVKKFNPQVKKILCFGLDWYLPNPPQFKNDRLITHWYDLYTDVFLMQREQTWVNSLASFNNSIAEKSMTDKTYFDNVINCNPQSAIMGLPRVQNYREAV